MSEPSTADLLRAARHARNCRHACYLVYQAHGIELPGGKAVWGALGATWVDFGTYLDAFGGAWSRVGGMAEDATRRLDVLLSEGEPGRPHLWTFLGGPERRALAYQAGIGLWTQPVEAIREVRGVYRLR